MRKLLLRLSALFSVLVTLALVVAACGGDEEPTPAPTAAPTATRPPAPTVAPTATPVPTPTRPPTATSEPKPVRGGIFRVRLLQDIQTGRGWDSHQTAGGHVNIRVLPSMMNGVLMTNVIDHTTIEADAAESWSVSGDGLTYTFKLRPNIKFHDGTPMTSKDVVFSLERARGTLVPTFNSQVKDLIAPYTDTITAPDPLTVVVKLKKPSLAFLGGMAVLFMMIYPEHKGHEYPLNQANPPIGTGPYVFQKRDPNVRIEVRKNPNYFKKDKFGDALPYFDGIDYELIPSGELYLAAFRTGRFLESDYLDSEPINTNIDALRREFPTYNFKSSFGSWSLIGFGNKAPFNNVLIRRALDVLIDRDAFNVARYKGIGSPVAGPMHPTSLGGVWGLSDAEISALINTGPRTAAHIQRAKDLFAQAGVKFEGFAFELLSLGISQFDNDALIIKDQWERAGLTVKFNNAGGTAVFNDRRLKGDYDSYFLPSTYTFDDPDPVIGRWYVTGAAFNGSKFSDPKVDTLYAQQSAEIDRVKRNQITAELQKYILTDANWYPKLNWRGGWVVWSPKIKNYNAAAPGGYAFRARHEITWVEP